MSRLTFILDLGLILHTIGEMCESPFHLKTAYSLGPAKSSDFITNDIGYMIISDELSILKLDVLDQ